MLQMPQEDSELGCLMERRAGLSMVSQEASRLDRSHQVTIQAMNQRLLPRSEERRVGKECRL